MFEKWLIGMVVAFVLRQVAKFRDTIDWAKVKADLDARVTALVPGVFFDSEAVALVNALLDRIVMVLGDTADLQKILDALAASDWAGAYAALLVLIQHAWTPTEGPALKAAQHVAAMHAEHVGKAA
jgi:hypothetical protein